MRLLLEPICWITLENHETGDDIKTMLTTIASNPAAQKLAKQVARQGARAALSAIGRSRQRRSNRGRWYAGKRLGIPPTLSTRQISAPVTRQNQFKNMVSENNLVQKGSEWLVDVTPNVDLVNGVYTEAFSINPADPMTFPRLSVLTSQYQKYSLKDLRLVYTPACATTQTGSVYLAIQSDPASVTPTTTLELLGLRGAQRFAPWQPASMPVGDDIMQKAYKNYFADNAHHVQDDDPTRTVCKFVLMTENITKGTTVGSLTIAYNVTLMDPRTDFAANSMAGVYSGVTLTAVNGSPLDITALDVTRSPPYTLHPNDAYTLRQRHASHCLVLLRYEFQVAAVNKAINLELNGVLEGPIWSHTGTDDTQVAAYRLPKGRNVFQLIPQDTGSITSLVMQLYTVYHS